MSMGLSSPRTNPQDWLDTTQVRDAVKVFANAMELKLIANDHKGGWHPAQCDLHYLDSRLIDEIREYQSTYNQKELIDIANFCMMLWNRKNRTGLTK